MTVRSSIALVVITACAGAAMAACGRDDDAAATSAPAVSSTAAPAVTATTSIALATSTTSAPTSAPTTTAPTDPPLFDFTTPGGVDGWRVVNDTVMGGVSSGELVWSDGMLVFTGELSLDNGGGFASMRSDRIEPEEAAEWAGRPGPRIVADGDGRTWTVEVRTDDDDGGWVSTMQTSADGLTEVELPWASFSPVTRFLDPRPSAEPLDPARVVSVAFYLVDGVEGPFRLGVRSIS
jgi:NADH dehydrogenase [ubiquinone] 1 alpha subcomplex assembly factor 1